MPQKRRRVRRSSKNELQFETYYVTGISSEGDGSGSGSSNNLKITTCHTDYQVSYDSQELRNWTFIFNYSRAVLTQLKRICQL